MAVSGKVHGQCGLAEADDDGVPGVGVLPAAVQEDDPRGSATPAQRADFAHPRTRLDALHVRQRTRDSGLLGVLGNSENSDNSASPSSDISVTI